MRILLVYPTYPDTFWSFKYALKFISKKACLPPLGLLTVAAMLPGEWEKRLVDMNVKKLKDKDLLWADYVLISAMSIQKVSCEDTIARCKEFGVRVIAGGPLFTSSPGEFPDVDHLVLNEAEITLPLFLKDLQAGTPQRIYSSDQWADITATPAPAWDLIDMKNYATMNVQYSRGCPFDCDFCNITVLYGRKPRTKDREQLLAELDGLYARGWKGGVFLVDDNFIGNKGKLKKDILPALTQWMDERRHPFSILTEVSINVSDDEELMRMMARAGFDSVFVGIESPHEESLVECSKFQNNNRDLAACVRKIQQFGMEVQAGFIVGFDNDPATIFDRLVAFIQETGIVTAMVGLLNAPAGTKLYHRLRAENRLLCEPTGDNTDFSINFIPKMSREALLSGYRRIVETIYAPRQYYARVREFLKNYSPVQVRVARLKCSHLKAALKSVYRLGIFGRERFQYWKLLFWSLFRRPRLLPLAITLSIYGYHFRKVFHRRPVCIE
ncbi:MAG: B12-binding domain-containing radical SAM protein [Nitrospirae bacterium GWC1_57_7]|nr:MAG: B12-binding domain-containing radical SAM protein [Nitrospirae bacterium GWC1_57_7]HAR46947.1 B12-binding domain-containing radical SAM protein [Nitrospiraceae bacterium]